MDASFGKLPETCCCIGCCSNDVGESDSTSAWLGCGGGGGGGGGGGRSGGGGDVSGN